MVFIHDQRADDPPGQFRVMDLHPRDELIHFADHTGARAKDKDLAGGVPRLCHRFKEAVGVRPEWRLFKIV